MKKLIIVVSMLILALPAFAAEKGETYLGPVLGYHFFDNDQKLDDKAELGLRLGYFFTDSIAVEYEIDYTKTDHDVKGDTNATSLSVVGAKFFDLTSYYKPFIFAGVGGLLAEDDMGSLVAGIGARIIANDKISIDFRVKDMLHSKGGRNDIIPSIALNYHFGSKMYDYPEPKKAEPAPEPKKDTDGDGVYDDADKCPATPKGYPVNAAGCTEDNDQDGVYDFKDKCLSTPAGRPVNETGCTPDTDKDGVFDFEDRCPNTMEGVTVNSAGCFKSATLQINFGNNSANIDQNYLENIQKFAVFLKMNNHINVEIQGHTDDKGAASYNKALSQKRADAVVKILTSKYGISKNRLTAIGYGEAMPLVPNDSPANMLKNRRIDTVVK